MKIILHHQTSWLHISQSNSIKVNQPCSTSSMQDKLIINGVQTKPSYVDCNYCHLPCTTQKLKPNIGQLNPIRDPLSMINSFHGTDSQKNTSGPVPCQMTSSILSSDQLLSHSRRTDFQLTSSNHIAALASSTTRALLPVQSISSSCSSPSLSSNSFPLSVLNNLPPPQPTSLANHTCPSYCYSFSPHSSKPISSVKSYTTLNHTHSSSSSVSSRMNNAKHHQSSFQQVNEQQQQQQQFTPIIASMIPVDPVDEACAHHHSVQSNPSNTIHQSSEKIKFPIPYSTVFNFSPQPPTPPQYPLLLLLPPSSFSSLSSASSSLPSFLPPPPPPVPPITSSSAATALFTCKSSPKTTSHASPVSSVLNNISSGNVSSKSDNNSNSFVSNGFKDSLANNKDLPTSNNTECSNIEEKSQSLPRFNLRYANVLHYPKYSNRRNSGFERRLKHTGLVLDAKPTLRLLRKFLQPFVNRDVDQIIKKYMDNFILLAVSNIREVLGEQSVSEADLNKFRQSLIRRAALRYFPERSHGSPANRQGGLNNTIQQTRSNTLDAGVQKSVINVTSQAKTGSSVSLSKCPNSKLQSGIPTPDSSESISCDNSPHLSPNTISDSGSLEKPSFLTTNSVDSRTDKTLKTVQSNHQRRPVSRDGESQYSLRNNTSLGNLRKRPRPSNNHTTTTTASSESCDNPISDGNKPLVVTNCAPIILDDNNINDLRENCPSLQFSSHSPSSASSNSTVGFFRDACSSDSDETLIGSNTTASEQTTTFAKLSSAYEFNQSSSGVVTSTVPSNVVPVVRRNKPKVSRGRKTPWWDRTRAKKAKPSRDNDAGGSGDAKFSKSKNGSDNHKEKLINGKKPLNQGDNRSHNASLGQDVISSGVNNNNDSNQSSSSSSNKDVINATELYSNQSQTQHHNDDTIDENSNKYSCETSSRLFRKTCTEATKNGNMSTPNTTTTINNKDKAQKFTLDQNTSFALGSTANSWLGMGTARGRIYSKHPELFRYACDNEDKAWLVQTGVIVSHGVKAYLVHAEQVYQIAEQINSHITKTSSTGRGTEKLKTFKLPQKILQKVRNAALNHSFFSHIISTEYDVVDDDELMHNTKAFKTKPHNSSSCSSSSSSAAPPRTNYRNRSKTDIPLHALMNQTKSTDLLPDSFQHLSTTMSSSSSSSLSSSFMTSKSSLNNNPLSSHERDYDCDVDADADDNSCQDHDDTDAETVADTENNKNTAPVLNRNHVKVRKKKKNNRSTTTTTSLVVSHHSKAVYSDDALLNSIHSQPSPNPPTLERFDYHNSNSNHDR
ncbi:unnamed protein product [Trichobilharzia szidati]|nr:unnamed protein product [Trichobilharzia szidati]